MELFCIASAAVVIFIGWLVIANKKPAFSAAYGAATQPGIAAVGILLSVSPTANKVRLYGMAMERRSVTIDIEVPGSPPYELQTAVLVPLNLVKDVVPGATVEVRIDPSDRTSIRIVGPGVGFAQQGLRTTS